MDGPRQIAGAPIAAAVQQTADAPEDVAQGNARRQNIGSFPERKFFAARIENEGQRCPDQSAVINQPAVVDHKDFRNRLAGELFAPKSDHVERAGAQDEPRPQIGYLFGSNSLARGPPAGGPKASQKTQRNHDAIPVDGERAELQSNRMHNLEVSQLPLVLATECMPRGRPDGMGCGGKGGKSNPGGNGGIW